MDRCSPCITTAISDNGPLFYYPTMSINITSLLGG